MIIPICKGAAEFSPLETSCLHCRSLERSENSSSSVLILMFSKYRARIWMKATFQVFFHKRRYRFSSGHVLLFNLELKTKVWYFVVFFLFFSGTSSYHFPPFITEKSKIKGKGMIDGRNWMKTNALSF